MERQIDGGQTEQWMDRFHASLSTYVPPDIHPFLHLTKARDHYFFTVTQMYNTLFGGTAKEKNML